MRKRKVGKKYWSKLMNLLSYSMRFFGKEISSFASKPGTNSFEGEYAVRLPIQNPAFLFQSSSAGVLP